MSARRDTGKHRHATRSDGTEAVTDVTSFLWITGLRQGTPAGIEHVERSERSTRDPSLRLKTAALGMTPQPSKNVKPGMRHPEGPRFHQRAEGSRAYCLSVSTLRAATMPSGGIHGEIAQAVFGNDISGSAGGGGRVARPGSKSNGAESSGAESG